MAFRVSAAVAVIGALGAVVAATLASDGVRRSTEERLVAGASAFGDRASADLTAEGWPTDALTEPARVRLETAAAVLEAEEATVALVAPDGTVLVGDAGATAQDLGGQALLEGRSYLREDPDTGDAVVAVPLARDGGTGFVVYVRHPAGALRGSSDDIRRTVLGAGLLATLLLLATIVPLLRAHDRRLRERASAIESLLERERADAAKLAEVDRLKVAFLTAVSHELRTPLTVIKGVGDLFEARAQSLSPEQIITLTGRMKNKIGRLEQLLGDLLDIDRLARGVLEPRRHPTDLRAVASRVVEDAQAHGHRMHLPDDAVTANVDPGHAERIIENLVRNAVKYTPAGTNVWISLHHVDGETRINVADNGPGIPAEIRDDVFDPFTGGDPDGANPGLGGGLTLVERLAQTHGGGAWLEDRPDGGTSVWVRLPDA